MEKKLKKQNYEIRKLKGPEDVSPDCDVLLDIVWNYGHQGREDGCKGGEGFTETKCLSFQDPGIELNGVDPDQSENSSHGRLHEEETAYENPIICVVLWNSMED